MLLKEIFTLLSLFIVNFYLKSCIFFLHFILYLHVWIRIRIQKAPESGSTTLFMLIKFVVSYSSRTVPTLHQLHRALSDKS